MSEMKIYICNKLQYSVYEIIFAIHISQNDI